jgi:hypothetical protein
VLDAAEEVFGFKVRRTEYPFGTEHYLKTKEIFPESAAFERAEAE